MLHVVSEYVDTFLLTYRSFTTSQLVFQTLAGMYVPCVPFYRLFRNSLSVCLSISLLLLLSLCACVLAFLRYIPSLSLSLSRSYTQYQSGGFVQSVVDAGAEDPMSAMLKKEQAELTAQKMRLRCAGDTLSLIL